MPMTYDMSLAAQIERCKPEPVYLHLPRHAEQERILAAMTKPMRSAEIQLAVNASRSHVNECLRMMLATGRVTKTKAGYENVWSRVDAT